jgi:RNA polymerase sigma factor (TIGR02999 family)
MPKPDISPSDDSLLHQPDGGLDAPPPEPRARGDVTELLRASREGAPDAYARVFELVYDHLRAAAHAQLRRDARGRAGGHTLSTTAVVHEAWLRLADPTRLDVRDRSHFLAIASRAMRQVLIQYARRFRANRRGGGAAHIDLDDAERAGGVAVEEQADTLVALDEALERLTALNPRLARVVECRYFGGLTEEETAEALQITSRTVRRDWVKARAWLTVELRSDDAGPANHHA